MTTVEEITSLKPSGATLSKSPWRISLVVVDACAVYGSTAIALVVAMVLGMRSVLEGLSWSSIAMSLVLTAAWLVFLEVTGSRRAPSALRGAIRALGSGAAALLTVAAVAYLGSVDFDKTVLIAAFLVGGSTTAAARLFGAHYAPAAVLPYAFSGRRLMVAGDIPIMSAVIADVSATTARVVEVLPTGHNGVTLEHGTDTADRLTQRAASAGIDAVVLCGALAQDHALRRATAWNLEALGASVYVAPFVNEGIRPLQRRRQSGWHFSIKRAIDVLIAGTLLVALAPVLAVLAAVIWLGDRGPVLFTQQRVGRNGEHFTIFKFRTMVLDAEEQVRDLQLANEADGPLFKMKHDPRVTRVGRVLRRLSLDELPQLINVLNGSMSLVGPRPALPREVAEYTSADRRRLLVVPGVTGLWQVNGRSDLDWATGIQFDQTYVDTWSVWADLRILMKTIPAVMASKGAY